MTHRHWQLWLLASLSPLALSGAALAADPMMVEPVFVPELPAEDALSSVRVSAGVMVFDLPEISGNFIDLQHSADGAAGFGAIDLRLGLGSVSDFDLFAGASLYGALGESSSSSTTTFSGAGTFSASTFTPSTGTINLTPSPAAAGFDATASLGAAFTSVGVGTVPGGANQTFGVSPTASGDGRVFAGATSTNGNKAAGYGAVLDPNGFTFLATGDIDSLAVTSSVSEQFFFGGADLTIGLGSGSQGATAFSGYVGPSYRNLSRDITRTLSIDIAEVTPSGEFPQFAISNAETLKTNYFGAVAGIGATYTADGGVVFGLGAELGLYGYRADYSGSQSVTFPTNVNGVLSPVDYQVGPGFGGTASGMAWSAEVQGSVDVPVRENVTLGLAGSINYLSAAPGLSGTAPQYNVSAANPGTASNAALVGTSTAAPTISVGDMWGFGVSSSLKVSF